MNANDVFDDAKDRLIARLIEDNRKLRASKKQLERDLIGRINACRSLAGEFKWLADYAQKRDKYIRKLEEHNARKS